MKVCGAPRRLDGANTMAKLMPRLCQSSVRTLATRASMLRPDMFTTMLSPTLSPSALATRRSNETSGGPE